MRHYAYIFRGSLLTNLAYRTWMITASITNLIYIVIIYYLWQAIYANSSSLNGLSFEQSFLYLTFTSTFFAVFKSFVDQEMASTIRMGEITNYLLKPLEHQNYLMASNLGRICSNLLFIVIPAIILVGLLVDVSITPSFKLLLFIPAIVLAYIISFLIDYMIGCAAFYTESIWGIFTTKDTFIMALSGVVIPFAFFPEWVQSFLAWSPFVAIYHTPVSLLLGNLSPEEIVRALANQAVWLLFFFALAKIAFRVSVRRLSINGG